MQSLRHAPHRLGPPDRPGARTPSGVFPGGRLSGSRLHRPPTHRRHRTEPRPELLRLQKTHLSRNGLPAMPGQLLYKLGHARAFLQRLPPVAVDTPMEMSALLTEPSSPQRQPSVICNVLSAHQERWLSPTKPPHLNSRLPADRPDTAASAELSSSTPTLREL